MILNPYTTLFLVLTYDKIPAAIGFKIGEAKMKTVFTIAEVFALVYFLFVVVLLRWLSVLDDAKREALRVLIPDSFWERSVVFACFLIVVSSFHLYSFFALEPSELLLSVLTFILGLILLVFFWKFEYFFELLTKD